MKSISVSGQIKKQDGAPEIQLRAIMENRRNYYRVLHVQPDAPAAVIKATYRTLMQKLKMHPDLGGDTWNAALVNEAYAVLSDPQQREAYDRGVLKKLHQRQSQNVADEPPRSNQESRHCLFCKTAYMTTPGRAANESCMECHSPMLGLDSEETQIALRRVATRINETFDITYYTYWPQAPYRAIARNFSPTGIAIEGTDHFFIGQLIKIESELIRAVAEVKNQLPVSLAPVPVRVGLRFVTASFNLPPGTFIAVKG